MLASENLHNNRPVHRNKELGQWTAHSLDHLVGNGGTTTARVKFKCLRNLEERSD